MTPQEALVRGLDELAIDVPSGAGEKLLQYLELLSKWNRTYNLTAIREPVEMVSHHVLDSLAVVPHLPMGAADSLADVGSGPGLPGIPIAIARPQWRVTLNDANEKKAAFLRQASIELQLANSSVHEGRAERWKPAAAFTVVISRAFAELSEFIRACGHLVVRGGHLAAMKGSYPQAELDAMPTGWTCSRVAPIKVPLLEAARHVVLCRQVL